MLPTYVHVCYILLSHSLLPSLQEPNSGYISPQIHSPHDNHSLCIPSSHHSTNVSHSPSIFKPTSESSSMNVTSKPALPALLVRRSTMDSILLKPQRKNLSGKPFLLSFIS